MSQKKDESDRKKISEQFHAMNEEIAQKKREMQKPLQTTVLPPEDEKDEQSFADYHQLLKAYRDKFKHEPEKNKEGGYTFKFNSRKEAETFFQEMAEKKVPFLTIVVDRNDKPTGDYYMSYGDGKLIKGSVSPDKISDVRKDFANKMRAVKKADSPTYKAQDESPEQDSTPKPS